MQDHLTPPRAHLITETKARRPSGGGLRVSQIEEGVRLIDPEARVFDAEGRPAESSPATWAPAPGRLSSSLPGRVLAGSRMRPHLVAARSVALKSVQATMAGRRWALEHGTPDLIVSTGPPHHVHITASVLARQTGAAWLADLRDPWSGNDHNLAPGWRRHLDDLLDARVLEGATAISATTHYVAGMIRSRHLRARIEVIRTGVPSPPIAADAAPQPSMDLLHIGYLYGGRRSPVALIRALRIIDDMEGGHPIHVTFVGRDSATVRPVAADHGVSHLVTTCPAVTRREAQTLMRQARTLLLLQSFGPCDPGLVPAKFYDYAAAGRPILHLGPPNGEAAELLRLAQLGRTHDEMDADGIAHSLQEMMREPAERWGDASALGTSEQTAARFAALLSEILSA